jgi:hypothetical protein
MGIKFFKKNKIDLDFSDAFLTVTDGVATNDGADFLNLLRNRDNESGWMTTDSDDTANTEIVANMGSAKDIDRIVLVNHNFKSFTIKYLDDDLMTWLDFSTPINETTNVDSVSIFSFNSVNTTAIRIIIDSTQIADADKRMTQLIMTEIIGELTVQPIIQPKIDRSRKVTKFLSGRVFVSKSVPSFEVKIKMNNVVNNADLTLAETLFNSFESFLVWLSGGDVTQFDSIRIGYRLEDFYLVNISNEYMPQYDESRWKFGVPISIDLQETN